MEWLKEKITFIFTRNVSSEQLTLSIVMGITLGLFPVPFLTTFVCIVSSLCISTNIPIMTTVNLMVTPIELAMVPMFVMAGNYLGVYQFLYGSDASSASFSITDLMSSLSENAFQGAKDFADILLVAIIAWVVFVPIASAVLYFILRPIVAKLILKFTKHKATE